MLHVLLGGLIVPVPAFAEIWAVIPLLSGVYYILKNRNKHNEAAYWAAYYVGLELLLRMTEGYITWEFGKYATILLLGLGFVVETRRYRWKAVWCVVVVLLLIPGILDTLTWSDSVRDDVLFNTSGMLTLATAAGYFYGRPFRFAAIKRLISWFLLPVVSVCVYLFFRTPDLQSIEFTTRANFATSGGFGPNQVASVLGAAWVFFLCYYLYKEKLTPRRTIDLLLFALVLFRSLLSFSRGGNYAAVIALFGFLLVHVISRDSHVVSKKVFVSLLVATAVSITAVVMINNVTQGVFANRFTGRNMEGEMREDVTTGRLRLLQEEWQLFKEHPLGLGAGGSAASRAIESGRSIATHNEFGRLLSEHGVLGLIIIVLMIVYPIRHYFKWKVTDSRSFLVLLCSLALATMMHSALRLALPAFLYGLSMVCMLPREEDSVHRK